ncbi:guanylate kinase [Columbia Basin potato purple top phytoplasma]|uniref:Guanylate kinase n=1 Tax=Columbia Basin potato purple top phytoplasma TaxID=307134 RepID=A0ABT5L8L4_9MOLU|nr:guanylate kinase [Columbia Basin potato purple top phytoplasma]MDC9031989.1 guanylate kinase [Columbia Basin potato purple top phytoplasma]
MDLYKKGLMIVISGPSGVGKDAIKKQLLKKINNDLFYSISYTTREPRRGEKEGKDYFFINKEDFKNKIRENFFIEYNIFLNNYYGTAYKQILQKLEEGKKILLEIDIEGALKIREHKVNKDCVFIFIAPSSKEVLYKRLKKRNTETDQELNKRMLRADEEMKLAYKYDYIVINDEIDNAVNKIISILSAEHSKTKNIINFYLKEILQKGN